MTNRILGAATIILMMSVNAALLTRDVLPAWLAGEPPEPVALQLSDNKHVKTQFGIFDRERRIGYAWSSHERTGELVTAKHTTALLPLHLPQSVVTPALRVETIMRYQGASHLEELRIQVYGFGVPIRFSGEYYPPGEFPCEWQVDDRRGELVLPASATRALGDVLRPFGGLTGLEVGRSWRIKMVNPLAGVIPGWADRMVSSRSILARVVAKATIEHRGEKIEAFVIQADRIRAWVTPDGRLLRQELELPVLGAIRLEKEPYDRELRRSFQHGGPAR